MKRARVLPGLLIVLGASACNAAPATVSPNDATSPLSLRRMIDLPNTEGRIDHLAVDLERHRLYVAEYGNGSVDEVDLDGGRVVGRIGGLREPQGIGFLPKQREVVVASGDGSVRFYAASDRNEIARIDLGEDADNVRIDPRNGHVLVGYGSGGIAIIDPSNHRLLSQLVLPAHPEGFRLIGARALINVPDRGAIIVADIDRARILASWSTGLDRLNFPLAIAPSGRAFAVAFRLPAKLAVIDVETGRPLSTHSTCGDADDLFFAGSLVLVVCGAGHVELISAGTVTRVTTAPGARTGLFVPEFDTLFVAAPARGKPAAIWALSLKRPVTRID